MLEKISSGKSYEIVLEWSVYENGICEPESSGIGLVLEDPESDQWIRTLLLGKVVEVSPDDFWSVIQ